MSEALSRTPATVIDAALDPPDDGVALDERADDEMRDPYLCQQASDVYIGLLRARDAATALALDAEAMRRGVYERADADYDANQDDNLKQMRNVAWQTNDAMLDVEAHWPHVLRDAANVTARNSREWDRKVAHEWR